MSRYIFDITRFISRIGRGKPTGIDRVDIAYLAELSRRDPNCLTVAKIGTDFVLGRAADAVNALNALQDGRSVGRLGLQDFYRLKLPKEQRRARQFFRFHAICSSKSPQMLFEGRSLSDLEYVNVGHSNLSDAFLSAIRAAGCSKITVMIHDMIPLDFPQFTGAGISEQFEARMKSVAQFAHRIICNSADTEARVQHYFTQWGASVDTVVAHLGVEPLSSILSLRNPQPYFVCLGTIEPRKNHALLFDVWDKFALDHGPDEIPELRIIGRRGWNNETVFKYLDTAPLVGTKIKEQSDLNDTDLATQINHCVALVFPSFAEGYGLPALEAAQMNVPVICSDLPVFRELLGEYATFLDPNDADAWAETLRTVAEKTKKGTDRGDFANHVLDVPRWESHFCHVFDDTGTQQAFHE
ncbi:glycosyltransferase family 1 protein [Amylibacter sp. IMCC11727]|uniref:glycosyltransferase family 4 protein n=1 Tax=Amylibacter sp. IMCC11727 TaxID=3039851 RepID=UPI00244E3D11|nr:glycosyltransferase family 1 protein [Amylibacter sp. IMCC11727]WGI22076.1 glycosyltransferase family 1 protein [Amylibacter sp. IMCC11727]